MVLPWMLPWFTRKGFSAFRRPSPFSGFSFEPALRDVFGPLELTGGTFSASCAEEDEGTRVVRGARLDAPPAWLDGCEGEGVGIAVGLQQVRTLSPRTATKRSMTCSFARV